MRSLAFLCAVAVALALPARAADEEIAVGLPAPTFTLKTLNPEVAGSPWIALERYVGPEPEDTEAKVVLVSFFASWCEPCKKELPFLVGLDRTYRDEGLRVLGVNIDREDGAIEAAKRLVERAGVRYPVLSDRFNFLARRYLGAEAPLPSVFLVRRDGTIARIERGYAKDASAFLLAAVEVALGLEPAAALTRVCSPAASSRRCPASKSGGSAPRLPPGP